jgi:hypothetical protein
MARGRRKTPRMVGIIIGGGSGHLPVFTDYGDQGSLDAALRAGYAGDWVAGTRQVGMSRSGSGINEQAACSIARPDPITWHSVSALRNQPKCRRAQYGFRKADARSTAASPNGVGAWAGWRLWTSLMPRRRATRRFP